MGDEPYVNTELWDEDGGQPGPVLNRRRPRVDRFARRTRAVDLGSTSIPSDNPTRPRRNPSLLGSITSGLSSDTETQRRPVRLNVDVPLLLILSTLVIFGLLMVNSASWKYSLAEYNDPSAIFVRQLLLTLGGIAIGAFLVFFDYHRLQKLALPLLAGTIAALVVVLFVHDERHGAVRTLLSGSMQPSEMAKLAIVIYLSVWLFRRGDQLHQWSFGLLPLGTILGIVGAFIILQPDLSATITIFLLGGLMFFLAGGKFSHMAVVVALSLLVGAIVVTSGISSTGKARFSSFMAGLKDPLSASDHVQRSMESFVKGGAFGVGIGKADTKLTVLPFPHTDSIFAVIGEETGVVGAAFLVGLYILLMWRGLVIARQAPDKLGSLLAAGLSLWIAVEAFINMAVMVGLMPFAGNALPLLSAGGSNRLVTLAAIGIILNISRRSEQTKEEKERAFSAVVDLRRRDWRRSVSRPHRPTNTAG